MKTKKIAIVLTGLLSIIIISFYIFGYLAEQRIRSLVKAINSNPDMEIRIKIDRYRRSWFSSEASLLYQFENSIKINAPTNIKSKNNILSTDKKSTDKVMSNNPFKISPQPKTLIGKSSAANSKSLRVVKLRILHGPFIIDNGLSVGTAVIHSDIAELIKSELDILDSKPAKIRLNLNFTSSNVIKANIPEIKYSVPGMEANSTILNMVLKKFDSEIFFNNRLDISKFHIKFDEFIYAYLDYKIELNKVSATGRYSESPESLPQEKISVFADKISAEGYNSKFKVVLKNNAYSQGTKYDKKFAAYSQNLTIRDAQIDKLKANSIEVFFAIERINKAGLTKLLKPGKDEKPSSRLSKAINSIKEYSVATILEFNIEVGTPFTGLTSNKTDKNISQAIAEILSDRLLVKSTAKMNIANRKAEMKFTWQLGESKLASEFSALDVLMNSRFNVNAVINKEDFLTTIVTFLRYQNLSLAHIWGNVSPSITIGSNSLLKQKNTKQENIWPFLPGLKKISEPTFKTYDQLKLSAKKKIGKIISTNQITELDNNYKFDFEYRNKEFLMNGKKVLQNLILK